MNIKTSNGANSGLPSGRPAGRARLRLVHSVLAILAGVTSAGLGMPVHAQEIYGFESLGANSLIDGQNNWVDQPSQGQGIVIADVSPVNGTKVVGVLPSVVFDEVAYLTRVNDENFSFPAFTGFESDAVIQFDLTGEHIALFASGHDHNGDGMLKASEGEIGPAFGTDDRNFVLLQANHGTAFEVAFGQGNAGDDWYRMQLRIDFAANDGNGSGCVFYRNLTDGDTEFQPVAGLQEIDLRLSDMSTSAGPETWDAMWLELLNRGSARPSADYLAPNFRQSGAVEAEFPTATGARLISVEPNPFRDGTVIRLNLPDPSEASLRVYDESGRRVRELIAGGPHSGFTHLASWNGHDDSGRRLAPGVYFYRLEAGSLSESGKVTLLQH